MEDGDYIPKPWRVKRDLREGKRGIAAGIAWAENGRAMADVEIVLKASPLSLLDQATDDGRIGDQACSSSSSALASFKSSVSKPSVNRP
jgi:hypothetical protein